MKDIMQIIKEEKRMSEIYLINRKNNINSKYELAKNDFIEIKNLEDKIEVLRLFLEEIEELERRINERNKNR